MLTKQQLILKSQQRFKNEVHNAYPAESDKIALSNNDDKNFKTFDRITSYPHGANAGRVCKTELLQYLNIKWLMLMIIQIKIEKNMAIWSYISDLPYRLLIVRDQKKNALLDLIIHRPKIDTIYLYAKDPYGEKYQFLISKRNKMILNLLLNAQMTCKMYIKIANIIIQKKKTKY